MKSITRFLLCALAILPMGVVASPVPTTMGDNLTAYNPGSGALNNNTWNTVTNSRSSMGGGAAPTADFGNCNALILRCAQPKCAGGGCADLNIATTVASGCVTANETCAKHGGELINYIAAQLVSDSVAAANAANAAAQQSAANAAAQQSAAQMQQMQTQMQQMQAEMAAQNAAQMQQMQAALNEQKQLTANAVAQATAAQENAAKAQASQQSGAPLTEVQKIAAESGVSAELLARQEISGQIMTDLEDAEKQLKTLKVSMLELFEYAGCDQRGNNCTGPKRIKKFKELANAFFDPYETVTEEVYDALVTAMSVGVDISDVMMLLNDSCNQWAKYWCPKDVDPTYTVITCPNGYNIYGRPCNQGGLIPESEGGCKFIELLKGDDVTKVSRLMLWGDEDPGLNGDTIRIACASEALFNLPMFANRKKDTMINIETLQNMIAQDEGYIGRNKNTDGAEVTKYCAIDADMYDELQKYVTKRTLPTRNLCISDSKLDREFSRLVPVADSMGDTMVDRARGACVEGYTKDPNSGAWFSELTLGCYCYEDGTGYDNKIKCNQEKSKDNLIKAHDLKCRSYGDATFTKGNTAGGDGIWGTCNCDQAGNPTEVYMCNEAFGYENKARTFGRYTTKTDCEKAMFQWQGTEKEGKCVVPGTSVPAETVDKTKTDNTGATNSGLGGVLTNTGGTPGANVFNFFMGQIPTQGK